LGGSLGLDDFWVGAEAGARALGLVWQARGVVRRALGVVREQARRAGGEMPVHGKIIH
jgi:hypothetical protein